MPKANPCEGCGGKCCRYFALQIDTPTEKRDFEDIRWYLCHENTKVFVEEGAWYLEVQNVCRYLDESGRCAKYKRRPTICREHAPANCEHTECEFDREFEFHDDQELRKHMRKIFKSEKSKKKKKKK